MSSNVARGAWVRGATAAGVCVAGLWAGPALAQPNSPGRVDIAFNRYYTQEQTNAYMRQIAQAYPELVTLSTIGRSREGREMVVAIVTNPRTGEHSHKPAMWIDGNVHGNEIQATEVVLYTLWYLTKSYGQTRETTSLLDDFAFYLLPSVNPDGREAWFREVQTSSSSRWSVESVDNDRDGLMDEDPTEDLDGDGSITTMWKADASGDWIRDELDPRAFRRARVEQGERGSWVRLGSEGIDNDGDGQINEDGVGGYDMNRSWPSGWLPSYVQFAAAPYPLADPETRAIAEFILAHPNIAAGQSYHNSGGMVLRGPGAAWREDLYPAADRAVYDEIGQLGAKVLPYYSYWVIHKDLYVVHGGFVNWLSEGLGIIAFTNELMTTGKYFQRDGEMNEELAKIWRDRVALGTTFTEYREFEHPQYGTVLIGGPNKWSSRSTPGFMLEEECHRNFAFTAFHASQMPVLSFARIEAEPIAPGGIDAGGDGLWRVTVEVRNRGAIPTRLAVATQRGMGSGDVLTCEPGRGAVLAGGTIPNWVDDRLGSVRHEPGRLVLQRGVPGRGDVIARFVVRAEVGERVEIRYRSEKAKTIETSIVLGQRKGSKPQ